MVTVSELIIKSLKERNGIANIDEIYFDVNQKLEEEGKILKNYKHTVRGIIYRLKKENKISRQTSKNGIYQLKD